MTGSRRIEGGINHLVDEIVAQIDTSHRFLDHIATGLSLDGDVITVDVDGPSGQTRLRAKHVALAIPPRLAAELEYSPELPLEVMQTLAATPTWMAGHAKFFAVYDEPFWRQQGLCSDFSLDAHIGAIVRRAAWRRAVATYMLGRRRHLRQHVAAA